MLEKFGTGQGWLKAGFLGFPKSGKSYTGSLLAIGLCEYMKLDKPVAFFDTEGGTEYLVPLFKKAKIELTGIRARSFSDLMALAQEAEKEASILIVDSITHPWRELCDSHLKQINEQLAKKQKPPRTRLEFPDWNKIKENWGRWTDFYLNSRLHIIICGRAGFEWEMQDREDGPGKDLIKTGVKMKVESEFGFEPSLLIQMERVQEIDEHGRQKRAFVHRATVIGDRFAVIDGATCDDPGFEFFLPHIELLRPGAYAPIDTAVKTDTGVDEQGDDAFTRERRLKTIALEEIQGELLRFYPGQTTEHKTAKAELISSVFDTRSWTKVEGMGLERLKKGLAEIRARLYPTEQKEEVAS